jgi:hypothetical protein
MSLETTQIQKDIDKKANKSNFEGKLFNLLLLTVVIGFPCLLTFLTWKFWGAGLK